MSLSYHVDPQAAFAASTRCFEMLCSRLCSSEVRGMSHAEVETLLEGEGAELLRQLFQDHLDLRAHQEREASQPPRAADGTERSRARRSQRRLRTVFGDVEVHRLSWTSPGVPGLRPLDAELNLPRDSYSFGVRQEVARLSARVSYDTVVDELDRGLPTPVPKRQVEELAARAAQDFDAFHDQRTGLEPDTPGDLLLISADYKGVVTLPESQRAATREAAERAERKLEHHLCRGEKANRKRMAAVAAVWSAPPCVRRPEDIVRELRPEDDDTPVPRMPRPRNKRCWARLERNAHEVLEDAFDEAERRDPEHRCTWVVLVDGARHLTRSVRRIAEERGVEVVLVLDIIHVLGHLWTAGQALHGRESPEAEAWVTERLVRLLEGRVSGVAGGMRCSATLRGLTGSKREAIDKCADYLLNRKEMVRYDIFLAMGLPIATGVVEGACRHLVNDRMGITGARWSVDGGEAILRLRALLASGDFDEYWSFHQRQEFERNHRPLYDFAERPPLRLVA